MATTAPQESIQQIGRDIVDDARRLVQLEVELAKAEAVRAVKGLALEIGLFVVALVFVLFALAYAILAVPESLGALNHWWGWLASAGVMVILAVIIGLIGYSMLRRTLRRAKGSIATLKGDAEWAKALPSRRDSSAN